MEQSTKSNHDAAYRSINVISVIVPVYNAELYIEKCLDSICGQTYSDLEILLIDDGSSDKSVEICNQYAQNDLRIKVFTQSNQGVSHTRNRGIEIAKGDSIIFVDSDDYIHVNMLQDMNTSLESNQTDICFCGITEIWQNTQTEVLPNLEIVVTDDEFAKVYFSDLYKKSLLHAIGNKLIRRSVLHNTTFASNMSYFEDVKFTIDILLNCQRVSVINKGYYFYFHHTDSLSNNTHRSNLTWAERYADSLYRYMKKYEIFDLQKNELNTLFSRCILGYLKENYSDNSIDKKKKYKLLKEILNRKYTFDWITNNAETIRANKIILVLMKKRYYSLVHILCQWKFGGVHGK